MVSKTMMFKTAPFYSMTNGVTSRWWSSYKNTTLLYLSNKG